MPYSRVYRIYDGGVRLELEAGPGKTLDLMIVDGRRSLVAILGETGVKEFLAALADSLENEPRLIQQQRGTCYWSDRCSTHWVPDMELISSILLSIRSVLAKAPGPIKCYEEDGCDWVWSPQEEMAARKAAILLDIAAMILKHPEVASKLPSDVEMLIRSYEEQGLERFLGKKAEAKAEG